jgi:hypothetical protein
MKLTTTKSIRFTKQQIEAFVQLENYNVNVSKFIRLAISEKIKRDWKSIKEKKKRIYCPF